MVKEFLKDTIVLAGMSGGKDSAALALWLVHESGIPRQNIRLQMMDTGNEDAFTYGFVDIMRKSVGEIEIIKPERDFWELAIHKKRFPSRRARFCTQMLKVIPSHEEIARQKNLADESGMKIVKATGSRHEEGHNGNNRGDLPETAWDAFVFEKESYAYQVWYPIREWTVADVWAIHQKYLDIARVVAMVEADEGMDSDAKASLLGNMKRSGIPRNPLYDMGARRVGCFPCINSNKKEMRAMAYYRPERIYFIAEREEKDFVESSNFSYSSLFQRKTVPMQFRSRKLIDKRTGKHVRDMIPKLDEFGDPIDDENGNPVMIDNGPMMICTIHDVVEWSKTKYGGKQYEFFLPDEDSGVCLIGGECE